MLYLVDQFPSAAVRLKDVWHHFISRVFQLSSCVTSITSITLGRRSVVYPSSIGGRSLGPAGVERVQVGRNIVDNGPESVDLLSCMFIVVPCRREVVQFECKPHPLVCFFEIERSKLPINLQRFSIGF
jgi:hypothetical protein